ncbi:MAG: SRPBCC domain-containing protein [Pseudolysinimonas sp.]
MTPLLVKTDADRLEVTFERELPASAADVWRSWTRAEELEAWWGPIGWTTTVRALDVRPGGLWHFGMGPAGEAREVWIRSIYTEVITGTALSYLEGFSDDQATDLDPEPNNVTVEFIELDPGITRLVMRVRFASAERLEAIIARGLLGGWESAFDRLEQHVEVGA